MKLKKCYIENFGMLSQKELCFRDGVNCFLSDNGTGKTTLSMFIMSMLYGIGDSRKSALSENDRKKYAPWQGGAFGGSLTFEANGKLYTVERSFGSKPALDTFKLIFADTGAISRDFSENLGEELFEIDRDGFLRTVFLSEKNIGAANDNKSISAKLSDLVGVDGDVSEFDKAQKLLEEKRREYSKRGGNGKVFELKEKISDIEDKLDSLDRLRGEAAEKKSRLSMLAAGIDGLEKERKIHEHTLTSLSKRAATRAYAEQIEAKEGRLREERSAFKEFSAFFKNGVPSFSTIDRYREDYDEGKRLLRAAENSEDDRLSELSSFFPRRITKEEIEGADRAADELTFIENAAPVSQNSGKSHSKPSAALLTLSIILTLLGAVLAFISLPLALISLLGIVILIITVAKARPTAADEPTAPTEDRRQELTAALDEFLLGFDIDESLGYKEAVSLIREKFTIYEHLLRRSESADEQRAKDLERGRNLLAAAEKFLGSFSISSERPFDEISSRITEYNLKEAALLRLEAEARELRQRYGAESSESEPLLNESEDAILEKIKGIDENASDMKRKHALTLREYEEISLQLDTEDELRSLLDNYRERLGQCEKNLEIIKKTESLLSDAYNAMNSKYIGKTKQGFLDIIKTVGLDDGDYAMDVDFTVTKNERGGARSEESFSKGTRDIYALAVRLSLTDSLYEKEKPFLILDDPLLSLDDAKRERALGLIREYGKQRQIIYFTCAKERAL